MTFKQERYAMMTQTVIYGDRDMKRLAASLRKIYFFATCLHLAWSLFVVAYSIFGGYRNLIVDIPAILLVSAVVLIGAAGIFLQRRLFAFPQKKAVIIRYQIFYFAIPAVFSFGKVLLCNSLYQFGGFMPGMEELGFVVTFLFVGILAILGWIIFGIVFWVRKKRARKTVSGDTAVWEKVSDIFNLLSFFVVVITLAALAISYGGQEFLNLRHRQKAAENQAYLEQAIANLEKQQGRKIDKEDIFSEAFYYAEMTEYLAQNEAYQLTEADLSIGSFSHIQKEVLEAGRENYLEFAGRYPIKRGVEMLNQEILGNAGDETVSVSSELYVLDTENQACIHGCIIVTFDRAWNVIRIRCSDLPLV